MSEAIKVTWVLADGKHVEANVSPGHNLMEAATSNNIPGISGDCGGALACATCQVVIEETPSPLAEASDIEKEMLEMAPVPPTSASRLSCQIIAEPRISGIVLRVPV